MMPRPSSWLERHATAALLVLYVALYIVPLGFRPLSSPDEVRYGAISHEMITSGDWVSPHFNGVRYFEKPILGYWLNSVSMSVLGENPFALRLPTALSVALTALAIFWLTARFATRRAAAIATAIYLTTLLVAAVGATAVFDTFLTLFLTVALTAYCAALAAPPGRARLGYLVACGAGCAAAFLTKGFLALAIPVLVAVPYLALQRRWRELFTTAWVPILSAAILIAPWALFVHAREPDFWHYFFWIEHVQRFLGDDAQHPQPFWYFFMYAPLAGIPWIWALPSALQGLKGSEAQRRFVTFLACWIVLPWLFFSASRGKLMTYVLPCFPPLSMLLAIGLTHYSELTSRRWWRAGAWGVALILLVALAGLIGAQVGAFGAPPYAEDEQAKLVFAAVCLAIGAGGAVVAALTRRAGLPLAAFGTAGAGLFLTIAAALPRVALDNVGPSELLADGVLEAPDALVVSDASTFGAIAWYTKRDDIYVLTPGEIGYGLDYPESRARNLQNGGLARLIDEHRRTREIFIVVRPDHEDQIGVVLPSEATRTERGGLVRWQIPRTGAASDNG
jgi:4-amino-4-deoxy-L-arabinose transferase